MEPRIKTGGIMSPTDEKDFHFPTDYRISDSTNADEIILPQFCLNELKVLYQGMIFFRSHVSMELPHLTKDVESVITKLKELVKERD
jgi:hypothetical protein